MRPLAVCLSWSGLACVLAASCGYQPQLTSGALFNVRLGRVRSAMVTDPDLRACLVRELRRDLRPARAWRVDTLGGARLEVHLAQLSEQQPAARGSQLSGVSLQLTFEVRLVTPTRRGVSGLLVVEQQAALSPSIRFSVDARRLTVEKLCQQASRRMLGWARSYMRRRTFQ